MKIIAMITFFVLLVTSCSSSSSNQINNINKICDDRNEKLLNINVNLTKDDVYSEDLKSQFSLTAKAYKAQISKLEELAVKGSSKDLLELIKYYEKNYNLLSDINTYLKINNEVNMQDLIDKTKKIIQLENANEQLFKKMHLSCY